MFFAEDYDSNSVDDEKKRHLSAFFDHLCARKLFHSVKEIIIKTRIYTNL